MPLASRLPQRHAGFSLIAMSIIITVAAMVFVSVLPGQEAGDTNIKIINNEKRLERVEEAMRSFMAVNGRRPCPADGQYAENTANFGREASTGGSGACTGGTPAAPLGPDAATGNIVGGVIPTRSLGLPDDYQYDDFGRRFTYVVDQRATKHASCLSLEGVTISNTTPNGSGGVTIENATGGTVIDNTMVAYISSGVSGYGAFPEQGGTSRINSGSTDTDMQTNANTGYGANSFTSAFVQKARVPPNFTPGDTGFDELVWYRPDIRNTCCLGAACQIAGFRIDGEYANQNLGIQQMFFADVNGDGIPDLIMTAQNSAGNGQMVYVVFGQSSSYSWPDPLNVSTLNGTNGFAINIPNLNPYTNIAILPMDFNGDGVTDLVILAASRFGWAGGGVYIMFGQKTAYPASFTLTSVSSATNPKGMAITNAGNGWNPSFNGADGIQTNLAHGDVNGDGIDDLIIGDWAASTNGIYVIFGTTTPPSSLSVASGLTGANGFYVVDNVANNVAFGVALAVGDFNGDGVKDILVSNNSNAWVVWGHPSGYSWPASTNRSALTSTGTLSTSTGFEFINGSGFNDLLAGDVNGDGIADMIMDPGDNRYNSYVVYGQSMASWNSATFDLTTLNGTNGLTLTHIGAPVEMLADVNGDGKLDWIQASTYSSSGFMILYNENGTSWGSTYAPLTAINGTNGVFFQTPYTISHYYSASWEASLAVGDINNDGINDMVFGQFTASPNGANSGEAYVIFGRSTAFPSASITTSYLTGTTGFTINGINAGDKLGYTVAVGDINNDGNADIAVAAPYATAPPGGNAGAGSVYVIFGKKVNWSSNFNLNGL